MEFLDFIFLESIILVNDLEKVSNTGLGRIGGLDITGLGGIGGLFGTSGNAKLSSAKSTGGGGE